MKTLNLALTANSTTNITLDICNPYSNKSVLFDTHLTLYFLSNKVGNFFFQTDETFFYLKNNQVSPKKLLQNLQFFKISNSYCVNIKYVINVVQHENKNYCELSNGEFLQIENEYAKDILNRLN